MTTRINILDPSASAVSTDGLGGFGLFYTHGEATYFSGEIEVPNPLNCYLLFVKQVSLVGLTQWEVQGIGLDDKRQVIRIFATCQTPIGRTCANVSLLQGEMLNSAFLTHLSRESRKLDLEIQEQDARNAAVGAAYNARSAAYNARSAAYDAHSKQCREWLDGFKRRYPQAFENKGSSDGEVKDLGQKEADAQFEASRARCSELDAEFQTWLNSPPPTLSSRIKSSLPSFSFGSGSFSSLLTSGRSFSSFFSSSQSPDSSTSTEMVSPPRPTTTLSESKEEEDLPPLPPPPLDLIDPKKEWPIPPLPPPMLEGRVFAHRTAAREKIHEFPPHIQVFRDPKLQGKRWIHSDIGGVTSRTELSIEALIKNPSFSLGCIRFLELEKTQVQLNQALVSGIQQIVNFLELRGIFFKLPEEPPPMPPFSFLSIRELDVADQALLKLFQYLGIPWTCDPERASQISDELSQLFLSPTTEGL